MRTEYVNRNLAFALSYAAGMQGITLQPEQLSTIMQTVNDVVFGNKRADVPGHLQKPVLNLSH
jgi:hypothetical protein